MRGVRLLWSNAVISLGAAGCVMRSFCLTGWEGNHATPWVFALGLAASTWLAYTWQRHVKSTRIDGLRPEHAAWHARQTKKLAGLSLIVLPLALWPLWLSWQKWMGADATDWVPVLVLATAIFLTALYAGLPGDRGIRFALRRLPRMKLMWIGLVWALVTAAWPAWWLHGQSVGSTLSWGALMTERACIIMALTLPFDLRDRDWDPPEPAHHSATLGSHGHPHCGNIPPDCRLRSRACRGQRTEVLYWTRADDARCVVCFQRPGTGLFLAVGWAAHPRCCRGDVRAMSINQTPHPTPH